MHFPLQATNSWHQAHQPKLMPAGPPPAHAAGWVTDHMGTQNLHKVRRKIDEQTPGWYPYPSGAERSPPACWPWLSSAQPPKLCSLLRSTHMAWAQCLQVDQLALSHPSCDLCKWAAPSTFGKWIISPIASTSPEYKHSKERTQLLMRQNKLFCHGRVHKEGRQEAAPPHTQHTAQCHQCCQAASSGASQDGAQRGLGGEFSDLRKNRGNVTTHVVGTLHVVTHQALQLACDLETLQMRQMS